MWILIVVLAVLAALATTGCAPSGPGSDVGQPSASSVTATINVDGTITVSLVPEVSARSVTGRWPFWASAVPFVKNDDTGVVLQTKKLTPAAPSATFGPFAAGTPVRVGVPLYASDPAVASMFITDGLSARGTIVKNANITLPVTLKATKPVLTVQSPTDGSTFHDNWVTVAVLAYDLGAGEPSVVLTDNSTTVSATPTITGDTYNGYLFTWAFAQADGVHNMVLTATSTSHLSASNSGISSVSWSYTVNTDGGVTVIVSSEGR